MNSWSVMMRALFSRYAAVSLLAVAWAAFAQGVDDRIVFVCEHGSVKSLIAASLFDRAAADRGLPYRAASRGVRPDGRVPPGIAAALSEDGFKVEGFRPQGLATDDIAGATRIIAIGVDLTAHSGKARAPIQSWDDVPAASVDYAAARAALQRHIDALLDDLLAAERTP